MFGMRVRILMVFVAIACAGVPAGTAAAQEFPSTLEGESVVSYENITVTAQCNEEGTSTLSYTAEGVAVGPYPGVYKESGTFILNDETNPHSGGDLEFITSPIDFEASFTIDSVAGEVAGTKEFLDRGPYDSYPTSSCTTAENFPEENLDAFCERMGWGDGRSLETQYARAPATYEARIRTAAGVFQDTGEVDTGVSSAVLKACERGYSSFSPSYRTTFYASDGLVPLMTPGRAQGGGQINHPAGTGAASAVTFGLTVLSDGEHITGECNVYDQASNRHLRCDHITQFAQIGNTAIFSGRATWDDGESTRVTIEVEDGGSSGIGRDAFSVETEDGYARAGVLTEGDIQVGQSNGSGLPLP